MGRAADVAQLHYSAGVLRVAGYSVSELRECGFTPKELKAAGFTLMEMQTALSELELAANYWDSELRAAGAIPASNSLVRKSAWRSARGSVSGLIAAVGSGKRRLSSMPSRKAGVDAVTMSATLPRQTMMDEWTPYQS